MPYLLGVVLWFFGSVITLEATRDPIKKQALRADMRRETGWDWNTKAGYPHPSCGIGYLPQECRR